MININDRIHSTAVDEQNPANNHVVASASEIFDDTAGKKQSEINHDTDAELANRYTKDETYSKSELNNLITTPDVGYTTVTATDQTTDIRELLPNEGSADAIYRVANWNGIQYDSATYTEYGWDGNQYVNLDTKQTGIDATPTSGSNNLIESGGVYSSIKLCNIQEMNDFVVDIVLKKEYNIDWSHYDTIWLGDIYGNSYTIGVLISDSTGTYPSQRLYSKNYTSESAALADFGTLMTTDESPCYIVLKHTGFSGGEKYLRNISLAFNRNIGYDSLSEHPIINALLIKQTANENFSTQGSEIDAIQGELDSIMGSIVPITLNGTCAAWTDFWGDSDNPIPLGSLIENSGGIPILAMKSYTEGGSGSYYTIPSGESWTAEFPVYRFKTGECSGNYLVKIYYQGNIVLQVNELSQKVDDGMSSVDARFNAITNTLYGGSEELATTVETSKPYHTARINGEWGDGYYFRVYTVDLTGAYSRGYKRVRFYGFGYSATGLLTQGLIATGIENDVLSVESYVTPIDYQAGYCELPITANSKLLVANVLTDVGKTGIGDRYPEGTDLDFVPTHVQLLNEDSSGVIEKIDELDDRVTELEEGGASSSTKFPYTYIPKKVYGVIGDTLQIFRRSVVVSNEPYRQYLDFTCGQGKVFERYFQVIPEKVSDSVPSNLTIKHCLISDDFSKSYEQTSNLVIADRPSSSSALNVLCIGASTTANGEWPSELKRRLTSARGTGIPEADGLADISFVGRMELPASIGTRPVSVKVEATGGWTWKSFYTPQAAVRFQVGGVTSVDVGTVYSYTNGSNQTVKVAVAEVNITNGRGNIRFTYNYDTVGTGLPSSAFGTLTRVSVSGGDSTITYSSAEEETYCPFYDETTGQPDFTHYASLYCNNKIDVLIAYMGNANEGIYGDSPDSKINTVISNMKMLIDAFHADFPNGKVIIGITALGNPWYGYEYNYSAASPMKTWSLRYGLYRYAKAVETYIQGDGYKDWCFYAGTHTEVDSEYGYPTSTKPVDTRSDKTDIIGTNGAHPILAGYQMIADSFYRCFANTAI
jgi:hypothetical protein